MIGDLGKRWLCRVGTSIIANLGDDMSAREIGIHKYHREHSS